MRPRVLQEQRAADAGGSAVHAPGPPPASSRPPRPGPAKNPLTVPAAAARPPRPPDRSIDQYFEFVLVLMLSTGLAFQVPTPPPPAPSERGRGGERRRHHLARLPAGAL